MHGYRHASAVLAGFLLAGVVLFAAGCGGAKQTVTVTETHARNAPVSVLVATRLITKGTLGSVIVRKGLYQVVKIPMINVQNGALVDPSALKGKVALQNVYPGQQLNANDFGVATS